MANPVPNSTQSFWRSAIHEIDCHRSTPELPPETDVLIIGAGYAGAATAYYLLKENAAPLSVTIIDAREVCAGATGRNGGHIKPATYSNVSRNSELYGEQAAVEIAQFEASQLFAIKDLVEEEGLDCDFHMTRALDVYMDGNVAGAAERSYRRNRQKNLVPNDVQFIAKKDAERVSGVKNAHCAFSSTAAHVWPYKLVTGLLAIALAKGLNLQTTTPVESISLSTSGHGYSVSTPRGNINVKRLVFAINGYTSSLLPSYKDKIIPVRGICSCIVTPSETRSPHLPNTYSLRWSRGFYDYLIPRPDGSIVVGGARQDYFAEKSNWYNVTDDTELMGTNKDYFEGYMQRHFRGWEESEAHVSHLWTGIMGYSSDWLPHVGEIPGTNGEQMILAGFTGHGMPQILLCARAVAGMVRYGKSFEETGLPKPYKTSQERLNNTRNEVLKDFYKNTLGKEEEQQPHTESKL